MCVCTYVCMHVHTEICVHTCGVYTCACMNTCMYFFNTCVYMYAQYNGCGYTIYTQYTQDVLLA